MLTKMVYSYYEYSNYGRQIQNPLTKFIKPFNNSLLPSYTYGSPKKKNPTF